MRQNGEEESPQRTVDQRLTEAERLIEHGQGDDALALLDRVIGAAAAPSALSRAWWLKSSAVLSLRRPLDALAAAEVAVAAAPQSALAYNQLAYILVALKRFDVALSASTTALELAPDDSYVRTVNARVLNGLGRHEQALVAVEQAVKLGPNNVMAWSTKGATLVILGHYAEALAAYDEAVRLYHGPPHELTSVLETRAAILSEMGRHGEALGAAQATYQLDPSSAASWRIAGFALLKLMRYQEALTSFQKYTQLRPADPSGWYGTGFALKWLDRLEEALAAYDRALALDSTYRDPQEERAQVLAGLALEGHWPVSMERASEPMLANPDLWLAVAYFYWRLKHHDEAIAACDEAVALNPNDPNLYFAKYVILRRQLHLRKAWAALRQYAHHRVNQRRQTRASRSESSGNHP